MEKISKEELMKKLDLSENELDKVAGGSDRPFDYSCFNECLKGEKKIGTDPAMANKKCASFCMAI